MKLNNVYAILKEKQLELIKANSYIHFSDNELNKSKFYALNSLFIIFKEV